LGACPQLDWGPALNLIGGCPLQCFYETLNLRGFENLVGLRFRKNISTRIGRSFEYLAAPSLSSSSALPFHKKNYFSLCFGALTIITICSLEKYEFRSITHPVVSKYKVLKDALQ